MLAIFSRTRPKSAIDLAESFPLLGIGHGLFEGSAGAAEAHGAEFEAPDVENVEGDGRALADFAKHVLDRHLAVTQNDGASGGAADAHLDFFRARGESGEMRSTRKAVNFSPSTLANTVNMSAKPALVIHIFSPFRM